MIINEHWFFATGYCSESMDDLFIVHPTNQTALFGESVNFVCVVSSCDYAIRFLVNGDGLGNLNQDYYKEIHSCDHQGQHVAVLSIIINDTALGEVKYVNCDLTRSDDEMILSHTAYITNCPCQLPTKHPNDTVGIDPWTITSPPSNTAHEGKLTMTLLLISLISQLL